MVSKWVYLEICVLCVLKCLFIRFHGLQEGFLRHTCRIAKPARQEHSESEQPGADKPDVKSLSSMLAARWKAGPVAESSKAQEVRAGPGPQFSNHDSRPGSQED